MRTDFTDSLRNGLRPVEYAGKNVQFLQTANNILCTQFGLTAHEIIQQLIASGELTANSITVSHPYPQVFKGKGVTLLCTATKVYTVNESTWTLTQLTTYDLRNSANAHSIPSGGVWHFADFHTSWFLFNGACTVMKTGWVDSTKTLVQDEQTMKTGCDFRGQLIIGGLASDFWTAEWQTLWGTLTPQGTAWSYSLGSPGQNWLWWSSIGGGDIGALFLSSLAVNDLGSVTGGHDSDRPFIVDMMRRVESSMMPMDFQGTILRVEPLRNAVVVYGEDGVSAIFPASSPVPTFGLEDNLLSVGIAARNAVCSDGINQFFVDAEGFLWSITPTLQLQKLGYQEYLSPMLGNDITLFYDRTRQRCHITDGVDSYVLFEGRLSKQAQIPTALLNVDGGLAGLYETEADESVLVKTTPFDLGTRKAKTIYSVELSMDDPTGATMIIYYRDDVLSSFTASETFTVDTRGETVVLVTGVEFYIAILCTSSVGFEVTGLFVNVAEGGKVDLRRNLT